MNTIKRFLLLLSVSISLAGCGREYEESLRQETSEVENTQISENEIAESMQEEEEKKGEAEEETDESEKLFYQFLNNEIAAYRLYEL